MRKVIKRVLFSLLVLLNLGVFVSVYAFIDPGGGNWACCCYAKDPDYNKIQNIMKVLLGDPGDNDCNTRCEGGGPELVLLSGLNYEEDKYCKAVNCLDYPPDPEKYPNAVFIGPLKGTCPPNADDAYCIWMYGGSNLYGRPVPCDEP